MREIDGEVDGAAADGAPAPRAARIERTHRWLPSLIWLLPLLAALIGAAQVVVWMSGKGPTISVSFASGDGLEAGKTSVKYKEVDIGRVVAVTLAADGQRVLATIALAGEAARFAVADSRFWVVRPRIGSSGVSGLGTLLSGPYIGIAPGRASGRQRDFVGLDAPPVVPPGLAGREYRLHADSLGSIGIGAPVYYHRLAVGQISSFDIDRTGQGMDLTVFIEARYVPLVGRNARWWHASGIDLRLDADGFKLNTPSLAALAMGGIAFDSDAGARHLAPAPAGSRFVLFEDRAAALREPDGPASTLVLYFDQSVRGLAAGAPVDFRGLVLGQVRGVGIEFDRAGKKFRMPVTIDVYPGRLGQSFIDAYVGDSEGRRDVLAAMVRHGLRGQLRTGSIVTGQMYVAIDFFPQAPDSGLINVGGKLILPTVASSLDDLQNQLSSIVRKLDKVPLDDIGVNLNRSLGRASALLDQLDQHVLPEAKAALAAARKTLAAADTVLQQDAPLQSDLRRALQQVGDTMGSLERLSDYLERHPEALIRGKPEDK